jgi:hypothetical protein
LERIGEEAVSALISCAFLSRLRKIGTGHCGREKSLVSVWNRIPRREMLEDRRGGGIKLLFAKELIDKDGS